MDTTNFSNGVLDSALDAVGQTPLIMLNNLKKDQELKCNLIAKAEFFSAGGSTKDRIARAMVLRAEQEGRLIPGKSIVIEPTSGNTGIGLAMACAIRGYKCIITLPEKMSLEKEMTLRAMGAEIVRTPTEKGSFEEGSHIMLARLLEQQLPHGVILDQYSNPSNPSAHFNTTYPEIVHSLATSNLPNKKLSVIVAGSGTGGTITGIATAMRNAAGGLDDESTNARWAEGEFGVVVGIDPIGSILATNGEGDVGGYEVEGIGYDFIPAILKPGQGLIHHWMRSIDGPSFAMAKRVHRLEGLLVGGSSGTAIYSAIDWLKDTRPYPQGGWERFGSNENANVVVLCADGIRNYMGKPWFLAQDPEPTDLLKEIEHIIGRPAGKPVKTVVQEAATEAINSGLATPPTTE
ncbi:cystathionine beta-synthase [Phaffia rhodozyma]|uniref:cystathionine beta-synthase n=1 Tax=Phaffia rhodozyma TaxID=264483 RepID=A0A0F7SPJ8_PHARH|nr:cystathionine beta-synthase [Phaffia rhodozyma]